MNRRYKVRLELEVDDEAELEAVKDGIFTFLDFHKDEPGMTFASTRKCERIVLRGWKEVKWAAVGAETDRARPPVPPLPHIAP